MARRLFSPARPGRLGLLASLAAGAGLATAPGAAAQTPFVPSAAGGLAAPAAPEKVDRDRDGVLDDLAQRLAGAPEGTRVRVIVSLRDPAGAAKVSAIERAVGDFGLEQRFELVDGFAATVTKGQVRRLAARTDVRHVEEDSIVRGHNGGAQTSFGASAARAQLPGLDGDADGDPLAYSAADLVAAVIDTGIDANHVALDGGKVLHFRDYVAGGGGVAQPYDDNGHGTHVAATIAGDGDGSTGGVDRGVAPRAGLIGLKTLGADGSGFTSGIISALEWVVANRAAYGIEVVNLSLGSAGCSDGLDALSRAANSTHDAGLVVAVAAGNSGPGTCTVGSPGAAAKALTVGNMADSAKGGYFQAGSSSRGPTADGRVKPDVSAPGVRIRSAAAKTASDYVALTGTSMAAPFVAGVALLMLERSPGLAPQQVKAKIMQTAVDWGRGGDNLAPGSTGADIDYGAGRLDAYAAISSAGPALSSPPAVAVHHTREGSLSEGGSVDFPISAQSSGYAVAGTLIEAAVSAGASFDLQLLNADGSPIVGVAPASSGRQDRLAVTGVPAGTPLILRVRSLVGNGSFFLDVSGAQAGPPPDTTAPETSITSGPGGLVNSRSASFGFASSEASASLECRLDAAAWSACTSPEAYASLADGSHTFEVRATDAAGNVDPSPASRTWTVDATAPDTSIASGPT
ncbi:MAG: S8 family serine peptidase, partial [Actinomycetota bacterium]|nr:S8 family serine peptidase [Actinomycetota bacterium]